MLTTLLSIRQIARELQPFFVGTAVQYDDRLPAQEVRDGIVYIGGNNASDTLHEMVHFVEIDEARMCKDTWGFYFGEWFPTPMDRYQPGFFEYHGTKDVERECRVIAWQTNVAEALGVEHDDELYLGSARFLTGFQNLTIKQTKDPAKNDRRRFEIVQNLIDQHRTEPQFSYDSFVTEWQRRNAILHGRKKTNR